MKRFTDRLEEALLEARYDDGARARLRRAATPMRTALGVMLALAVAGSSAAALTGQPDRTDSAGADEAADRCQMALQRRASLTNRRRPRPAAGGVPEPLRAVVAAFAETASGADGDAAAQCAGASIDAAAFYEQGVRYVGPGPFGGRTYLVAVPPDALPGPRAPGGGACVVTIGAPTTFDPTSGCDPMSAIAAQQAFRSAEVPSAGTVPGELAALGAPPGLRRGSFLTAVIAAPPGASSVRLVYRRYPRVTAEVRRNVVSVHVPRSAPNAFPRLADLLDETGHLVRRSTLEAGAG